MLRWRPVTLFLCVFVQVQFAGPRDSLLFVSKQWGMNEGLPQSSVNWITQTEDGYLWLATFGGLVRFDGEIFTVFDRSRARGLRSDRIVRIYKTRSEDIWCITEDGFARYRKGSFTTYDVSDGTNTYAPLMASEDAGGTLWVTADAKPYRFENDRFVRVPILTDPGLVQKALLDEHGVWLADQRQLLRTLGDSVVLVADLSNVLKYSVRDLAVDPEGPGRVWLAANDGGVFHYVHGKVTRFTEHDGLPSRYVQQLFVDHRKTLWVGCHDGLSKFNGTSFERVRTVDGTNDNEFNRIFIDRENNVWTGSAAQGLHRLRPAVLRSIGKNQGLREEKMLSLTLRRNGTMLFGTNCGGIYEWNGRTATYPLLNRFINNLCVWSLFEDSRARLWVGSQNLYRFDVPSSPGVLYDSTTGFTGSDVVALFEDSHAVVWIGCLNGLYAYEGRTFKAYTTANGLSSNNIRAVFEDRSGALWIGTTRGLNRYDHGTVTHVPLTPTNGDSSLILSSYIRAIHQDRDGTLWFGTYGGGILRLKSEQALKGSERFSVITTKEGLFDNIVSHIVEDDHGCFWMGSNRGISRIRKAELNDVADGKIPTVHADVYDAMDGMPSAETNGGFQPSVVRDAAGNIYFPTVQGVVEVFPNKVQSNEIIPPVYIQEVVRDRASLPFGDTLYLPYDSTRIEISFAALSYVNPKRVAFRIQLEGVDDQWINIGNRRTAFYSLIPPGEHRFHVIASNNDGVWNKTGASLLIIVQPPFWKKTWFFVLVVLVFVTSGPFIYYIRVSQLKKQNAIQEHFAQLLIDSQEQERKRIAAELHDGLGQQILVIKNQATLALRQVNNPEKIAQQLEEIVRSATSSIRDVRAISHGLRPPHLEQFGLTEAITTLGDQLQRSSTIEWMYHIDNIDGTVPRDKEINLFRVLQEGTNNIEKHSSAQQASLTVTRADNVVNVTLWDDGIGFDVKKQSEAGGLGLSGIQERVRTLGGTLDIASGADRGTVIKISIPLQHHG